MTVGTGGPFDPERLLKDFDRYDRDVDIVSSYHYLFSETPLKDTVAHFERYPKVKGKDGRDATPDFTVLYKDGTGLIGEIANIALHENSIEKLCKQLGRYSELEELPAGRSRFEKVSLVDVIYLSPMASAHDAARRIFVERIDNPEYEFSPIRRPVMIQFARDSGEYVYQFWADKELNGDLYKSSRVPDYRDYRDLKVEPWRFARNKVQYAFMNDTVSPLYMATRLWVNVFPTAYPPRSHPEFTTSTPEIVKLLKAHYSFGRSDDVRAAMAVLTAARLATHLRGDRNVWTVNRKAIKKESGAIQRIIADRIGSPHSAPERSSRKRFSPSADQGRLF
ncbi:hypothetical protein [Nocardia arizonensis]|uniref:hypothetical protein n=1 Tax=Nocardia arizonensis TaxID=1141647 RepID=UPI0012E163C3|nr:hypothetical protein [Nocardia arizonensis]